jgi:uncharacterized OB-fold protein
MTYQKPLPQPNADDKSFWDGCREHRLLFQKCPDCGLIRWPPSMLCPNCHSHDTELVQSNGKGTVYTYAIYHQAYHPGFEDEVPYVTAVIELEEGPHFLSNIVDCAVHEIECNMPVEVVWEDIAEEFSLPKFRPRS